MGGITLNPSPKTKSNKLKGSGFYFVTFLTGLFLYAWAIISGCPYIAGLAVGPVISCPAFYAIKTRKKKNYVHVLLQIGLAVCFVITGDINWLAFVVSTAAFLSTILYLPTAFSPEEEFHGPRTE